MLRKLLTTGEVAEAFKVSAKTVTRWAQAGKLHYVLTPGGHKRFYLTEVEELIDKEGDPRNEDR